MRAAWNMSKGIGRRKTGSVRNDHGSADLEIICLYIPEVCAVSHTRRSHYCRLSGRPFSQPYRVGRLILSVTPMCAESAHQCILRGAVTDGQGLDAKVAERHPCVKVVQGQERSMRPDQGPHAFLGEHFQQQRMVHPAVDDMGGSDPAIDRIQGVADLGSHAA